MRTILLALSILFPLQSFAAAPLLTVSGRYFVDPAGNRKVLTGDHTWAFVQPFSLLNPFDLTGYLGLVQNYDCTAIRVWQMGEPDLRYNSPSWGDNQLAPFTRTGPGNSQDGGLKWDLTSYNQSYFDTLSNRVASINALGAQAIVMMDDGWWVRNNGALDLFKTNWFNPLNNINGYTFASTNEVFTTNSTGFYGIYTNYVRKMVDTLNGFDGVMWEVMNESPVWTTNFQGKIAAVIKAYEATKPKQHLVGMSALDFKSIADLGTETIGNAQLVAQGPDFLMPQQNTTTSPGLITTGIPMLFDSDHCSTWASPATTLAWKHFMRGYSGCIYMDPWDTGVAGATTNQQYRLAQYDISQFAEKVRMNDMVASTTASDSLYALTNIWGEGIYYVPTAGNIVVSNLALGTYYYEWFDPTARVFRGPKSQTLNQSTTSKIMGSPGGFSVDALLLMRKIDPARGLSFDGTDDVITAGTPTKFQDMGTMTLMAWVHPLALSTFHRIIGKEATSEGVLAFGLGQVRSGVATNFVFLQRNFATANGVWHSPHLSINTNVWFHCAVTYDSGNVANDPIFYINGVAQTTTEWVTPVGARTTDAALTFRIGNSQDNTRGYNGYLRDVRVYSRILSAAEILDIYTSRGSDVARPGLTGFWRLDDGTPGATGNGASIKDFSPVPSAGTGSRGANATGLIWGQNTLTTYE